MGGGKVIVVKNKQEWDNHMANAETTYIVVRHGQPAPPPLARCVLPRLT